MEVFVFVDWTNVGRGGALVVEGGRLQAEPHAEIGFSGA